MEETVKVLKCGTTDKLLGRNSRLGRTRLQGESLGFKDTDEFCGFYQCGNKDCSGISPKDSWSGK